MAATGHGLLGYVQFCHKDLGVDHAGGGCAEGVAARAGLEQGGVPQSMAGQRDQYPQVRPWIRRRAARPQSIGEEVSRDELPSPAQQDPYEGADQTLAEGPGGDLLPFPHGDKAPKQPNLDAHVRPRVVG